MTLTVNFRGLETLVRRVPLGLRCVDVATGSAVTGGLAVTATPLSGTARTVPARPAESGYYSFQNVPGLRDFEFGDPEAGEGSPAAREFAVRVEDTLGRFLPWAVVLSLPRERPLAFQLLSAPSRRGVPGLMAVRGSLKERAGGLPGGQLAPAAFARVEARYDVAGEDSPAAYVGLADARGEFALFLPAPNPLQPPAAEPAPQPDAPARRTLAEMRWPLTLRFFYEPARQRFVRALGRGGVEVVEGQEAAARELAEGSNRALPDLASLLRQKVGRVFASAEGPPAGALRVEAGFMRDFTARTDGAGSDVLLARALP